jgi:hypothetical protein
VHDGALVVRVGEPDWYPVHTSGRLPLTGRASRRWPRSRRSPAHGGIVCQESMVSWPGDLLCVAGVGREDCLLAFLAAAGFVPPCGRGSSWGARGGSARQGARRSGGRGDLHPPAPTDPGVTVSRHRALLIR